MMLNIFLAKQETSRYLVFIDSYFPNKRLAWVNPMCVTLTIFLINWITLYDSDFVESKK